jgi:hypothetical protein
MANANAAMMFLPVPLCKGPLTKDGVSIPCQVFDTLHSAFNTVQDRVQF